MVCRLIQYQNIRFSRQCPRQQYSAFKTSRQFTELGLGINRNLWYSGFNNIYFFPRIWYVQLILKPKQPCIRFVILAICIFMSKAMIFIQLFPGFSQTFRNDIKNFTLNILWRVKEKASIRKLSKTESRILKREVEEKTLQKKQWERVEWFQKIGSRNI